jgi:hypothetical protein
MRLHTKISFLDRLVLLSTLSLPTFRSSFILLLLRSSSIFFPGRIPFFFEVVILVFQKKLGVSSIFFGGRLPFSFFRGRLPFSFFLRSSSIFYEVVFLVGSKIRLHTENQLPGLSGSALKVPVVGGVGWSY